MKSKIFWAVLATAGLFGCKPQANPDNGGNNDKDPGTDVVTELTAPVLTSDVTVVDFESDSDEPAVKLTWTSAGEGATYKLEAGTATPVVFEVEGLEKVITHKDLATIGEPPYTVVFKVKASAEGKKDVWSNGVSVEVNGGYVPPLPDMPEHLYLYFWGYEDATNAKEMQKVEEGVFTWTGDITQWQFKFLTSNATSDDYWTGYFRDPNASDYWTLIKSTRDNECMFQLNDLGLPPGNYTITVDLGLMKVTMKKNEVVKPLPEHLYIYSWEWTNAVNAKEMDSLGDGKFTWTGVLPRWNVKFLTANATGDDYWTGYFRDPDAADYWTLKENGTEVMFAPGDKGFRDGIFTVNVDLNTLKVEMIPHIWLIGAFDWGWDKTKAEEMTYLGDGQFTWTGKLYPGSFKFLVSNRTNPDDWYGYWRNSTQDNYWLAGEDDGGDQQFDIAHDNLEAGTYTIELNIFTKAVAVKVPVLN